MPAVKRSAKAAAKPAASKKAEKPAAKKDVPKVEKAPESVSGEVERADGVGPDGVLRVDLARIANSPQTEREAGVARLRSLVDRFAADPHGVIEP